MSCKTPHQFERLSRDGSHRGSSVFPRLSGASRPGAFLSLPDASKAWVRGPKIRSETRGASCCLLTVWGNVGPGGICVLNFRVSFFFWSLFPHQPVEKKWVMLIKGNKIPDSYQVFVCRQTPAKDPPTSPLQAGGLNPSRGARGVPESSPVPQPQERADRNTGENRASGLCLWFSNTVIHWAVCFAVAHLCSLSTVEAHYGGIFLRLASGGRKECPECHHPTVSSPPQDFA